MLSIPFTLLCTCAIHFHSPYFSRDSNSRQGRLNSPFFGGHSRVAPEKRRNGARLSLSVCLSVWLFGDSSRRRRSLVPFCAHPVVPSLSSPPPPPPPPFSLRPLDPPPEFLPFFPPSTFTRLHPPSSAPQGVASCPSSAHEFSPLRLIGLSMKPPCKCSLREHEAGPSLAPSSSSCSEL